MVNVFSQPNGYKVECTDATGDGLIRAAIFPEPQRVGDDFGVTMDGVHATTHGFGKPMFAQICSNLRHEAAKIGAQRIFVELDAVDSTTEKIYSSWGFKTLGRSAKSGLPFMRYLESLGPTFSPTTG